MWKISLNIMKTCRVLCTNFRYLCESVFFSVRTITVHRDVSEFLVNIDISSIVYSRFFQKSPRKME